MERRGFLGSIAGAFAGLFSAKWFDWFRLFTTDIPTVDMSNYKGPRMKDSGFIDLGPFPNRISRYKEYEKKLADLDQEMALNAIVDMAVDDGARYHRLNVVCDNAEARAELNFFYSEIIGKFDHFNWGKTTYHVMWAIFRSVAMYGDAFFELILDPNNPAAGILKLQRLPAETMYRIETVKGRLIEFQQSREGPDYLALTKSPIDKATEDELNKSVALRFHPNQVVHIRIGEERKTFYPYGVSILEYFPLKNFSQAKFLADKLRKQVLAGLEEMGHRHLSLKNMDTEFHLV